MPQVDFGSMQYQGVGGLTPGRSVLPLDHVWTGDMLFGKLYPIVAEECIAGDVINYSCDALARMNPTIVPFMHEVNISYHCFFVPFRIIWPKVDQTGDDWESYIVGATWDPATSEFVENSAVLPVWDYSNAAYYAKGSLYDNLGFQPGVIPAVGSRPHALFSRSYAMIWNEWYRDQDLQELLDITAPIGTLLDSAKEKDYYTSARPFQQKGIPPAFPLSGIGSTTFTLEDVASPASAGRGGVIGNANFSGADHPGVFNVVNANAAGLSSTAGQAAVMNAYLNDHNSFDFADAVTFNVSELRLNVQIQKYLERNARAGNRYTEWLQSHYGVSPRDERLQRPEYLGGSKLPVIVSEVLQTSETGDTPQGTMAGHGLAVDRSFPVRGYRVQEPGTFMVIARILPRTMYTQGVHRRAIRNSPYDFYHNEFAHLSEQLITKGEVFVSGTSVDNDPFGFQARYQEYRTRNSLAVGEMRDTLKMWNLGISFSAAPSLSEAFISVTDAQRTQWMTRAFAVTNQAPFIVSFGNRITMSRPMPGLPEPGLLDHF